MKDDYSDIILLPHHVSQKRQPMAAMDRAAQFSPFAALTGYGAAIEETARLTEDRPELSEEEQRILNKKQQLILERIKEQPEITVEYFVPDEKKEGGAYATLKGRVRRIDEYARMLIFMEGNRIPMDDITDIQSALFKGDL